MFTEPEECDKISHPLMSRPRLRLDRCLTRTDANTANEEEEEEKEEEVEKERQTRGGDERRSGGVTVGAASGQLPPLPAGR